MTEPGTNMVTNPRAHLGVGGWDLSALTHSTFTREASPPVALPGGCDACFKLHHDGAGGMQYVRSEPLYPWDGLPYAIEQISFSCAWLFPDAGGAARYLAVHFYDDEGAQIGDPWNLGAQIWEGDNEWYEFDFGNANWWSANGVTCCRIVAGVNGAGAPTLYLTKLRLDTYHFTVQGYRDGDSAGWTWDGAAHASLSHEVTTTNTTRVLINGGAAMVFSPDVTLTLDPGETGAETVYLSNPGGAETEHDLVTEGPTRPWTLADGLPGERQVRARFIGGAGT